jgi:hypothetical protein
MTQSSLTTHDAQTRLSQQDQTQQVREPRATQGPMGHEGIPAGMGVMSWQGRSPDLGYVDFCMTKH